MLSLKLMAAKAAAKIGAGVLALVGGNAVPLNEGATLATVITDATSFITASMGWIGQTMTLVMENPIILIPFFIMFAGLAWGLARRALNVMR